VASTQKIRHLAGSPSAFHLAASSRRDSATHINANFAADRLPKGALEEAVIEQMVDVYADGELIAEVLAEATVAEGKNREETEERIAIVRQQQAGARRASTGTSQPSRRDRCPPPTARNASAC
jgi:hypothetical protein